ncbi:MAG: Grx4 family monothiol glutaredoxin [Myxococcota bacterium]
MSAHERIATIVNEQDVVLFMKGSRAVPQCGFSATVVRILDDYIEDYRTVDVLADPEIREGIKAFSDWPTIPQLYVKGKFVGGSDIVSQMQASGELSEVLGQGPLAMMTPEVIVADGAIAAFQQLWDGDGPPCVRLEIDGRFQNDLSFDAPRDGDIVMQDDKFTLVMDRSTARRANGVHIDWHEGPAGSGFKIGNPSAPPRVRSLTPAELRVWLDEGKPFEVFDVRTPAEREIAKIEPSTLLDDQGRERLHALSPDTTLVLYCHHGVRSGQAAEHCLRMGFRDVYNVTGGIEAWSRDVDPETPRY